MSLQALALTRSLGRRGVPVVRVHPNRLDRSLLSRFCRRVEVCPDLHASEDDLSRFLLGVAERYPGPRVAFPATDDTAHFLGRRHDELSAAYRLVGPPADVVELVVDKRRQYEEAERIGIPVPETYYPASAEALARLAETLRNYPYVIKPNVAHRWRLASTKERMAVGKGAVVKGVVARDRGELIAAYARISPGDTDVMVQEVLGGEDLRLFTFLGYFDRDSRPLGYCVRSKIRQFPLDFGYCTATASCENPTVVEQSVRLLEGLRYQGLVGVEWKLDPRSGQHKLIEVNARAVNTSALAPACGVDLPWIAFQDALGRDVLPVTRWRSGVTWVWLSQDVGAARALRRRGELTVGAWLRSLRGRRVHAVFAGDDLRPFLSDALNALRSRLRGWFARKRAAGAVVGHPGQR